MIQEYVENNSLERRQQTLPRIKTKCDVTILGKDDNVITGKTINLGPGGMYLSLEKPLQMKVGDNFSCRIKLGPQYKPVMNRGQVVWCKDYLNYGIKFVDLSQPSQLKVRLDGWSQLLQGQIVKKNDDELIIKCDTPIVSINQKINVGTDYSARLGFIKDFHWHVDKNNEPYLILTLAVEPEEIKQATTKLTYESKKENYLDKIEKSITDLKNIEVKKIDTVKKFNQKITPDVPIIDTVKEITKDNPKINTDVPKVAKKIVVTNPSPDNYAEKLEEQKLIMNKTLITEPTIVSKKSDDDIDECLNLYWWNHPVLIKIKSFLLFLYAKFYKFYYVKVCPVIYPKIDRLISKITQSKYFNNPKVKKLLTYLSYGKIYFVKIIIKPSIRLLFLLKNKLRNNAEC